MIDPAWILGAIAAAGVFFLGLSGARLRRRRRLAAARSGLAGCATLGLGGLLVAAALNLYTYQRLTYEQPVASLSFEQVAQQRYRARIDPAGDRPPRSYELGGDQWELDARVLKWHAPANLLGLNAQYRLERLTGRYASAAEENSRPGTAHDLVASRGLDFWRLTRRYQRWMPLVDAEYGSAAYLPMADGARYTVSLTQSGLIARPENDAARAAVARW